MSIPLPNLDDRTYSDLIEEMRALIPRYAPAWTDHNLSDPGIMLIELFAWLTEALIYRLNLIPQASEMRFLELLGAIIKPAQPTVVLLTVTAVDLESEKIVPQGTRLTATSADGTMTLPFETAYDLRLSPETPTGTVAACQIAAAEAENLGISNGRQFQQFTLAQSFVLPEISGVNLEVTVDGESWTYQANLLDSKIEDKHFAFEPFFNAIRFGDGGWSTGKGAGKIPPAGAEIVANYCYTRGQGGNVEPNMSLSFVANDDLTIDVWSTVTPGEDPTGLDNARDQAIGALRTRWRAITATDFEEVVLQHPDLHVARAKCLPEVDLTAANQDLARPGHVSVIVVPLPLASLSHPDTIIDMALSPDGERLITISEDHIVQIWLMESRQPVISLPIEQAITRVTFCPGGSQVATAGEDNMVQVWLVENGEQIISVSHAAGITGLFFSQDGTQVITTDTDNTVRVWLVESGDKSVEFRYGSDASPVEVTAVSPDGTRVAHPTVEYTVRVWLIESGEQLAALPHPVAVKQVAFDVDGTQLITVDDHSTVRRWLIDNQEKIAEFQYAAPEQPVSMAVLSPNGARLATARTVRADSSDTIAHVWGTDSGQELAIFRHDQPIQAVTFSQNGQFLTTFTSDNLVSVWETELLRRVGNVLDERRLITCRPHVVTPAYTGVSVQLEVMRSAQVQADTIRARIEQLLRDFFHPLSGGPGPYQSGWPFGRNVYASELYQLIESTEGVDHVETLTLEYGQTDQSWNKARSEVVIPANNLVHYVPGQIKIRTMS